MHDYDILIEGAGPAGSTCALALRHAGLRVAVLDKHTFPRDKVCGDAIPGRAVRVLEALDPSWAEAFRQYAEAHTVAGFRAVAPNFAACELHFTYPGYTCPRLHFDAFLYDLARRHSGAAFFEGTAVESATVTASGVELKANGETWRAKLVVGSGGAHSAVVRHLTATKPDKKHYTGAVRAYFRGVSEMRPELLEVFLSEKYAPGYFWLFPLADGMANVGFGMRSWEVSQRNVRLKEALPDIIETIPELKRRFSGAEQIGKTVGFGLPMGSRQVPVSGDRFVLLGDAASLIDPFTGDGIGNAMLSAQLAAPILQQAFATKDFSAATLRAYDTALFGRLGKELRDRYRLQRFGYRHSWLLNVAIASIGKSRLLQKLAQGVV